MTDDKDANSSGCGYVLNPEQRFELIKAGFLLIDANNEGANFFSKIENVWTEKIYFTVDSKKYRAVFMTTPSILKEYVGKQFSCGTIYGFQVGTPSGGKLEIFALNQISFVES